MYNIKYKILPFMLLVGVLVSTLCAGIFITKATGDTAKRSMSYRVQEAFGGEEFADTNELSNTVKLLQDVKLTETLNIDRGINIDLNGNTIKADSATAFNINCSDGEGLTELEDPAAAEDSSVNISNGKIISADGYNGVDVIKGVVKLSGLEIQAGNSSPDNSTGSNAVYVKLTDSNSKVTIENSTLSNNIEDPGSYGLYIDDESNTNIELPDSTVGSAYIPQELIENIIDKYGGSIGAIVGAADENLVTTGASLVRVLGGSSCAESTSEKITRKVGTINSTNTVYTVTLKQDVVLKTPIRLVSNNVPLDISSYIINLNGYTISADANISGTTLISVGGQDSHRGPGKVEIKNGVLDCSKAPGVTSLQLGTMMTEYYMGSGGQYNFTLVGVDSTVKFTGITAVGGPATNSKKAGDAIMVPTLTITSDFDAWPRLIVDGSKLIGGKGTNVNEPDRNDLDKYGFGLNIVQQKETKNETLIDLRADEGDTYINRLHNSYTDPSNPDEISGQRPILRNPNASLVQPTDGFVDSENFFVQTRDYAQLTDDTKPTAGDKNIYSPTYPRDVTLDNNSLAEDKNDEEYVNVIIRKMQFIITIPEEVEVKDEGEHTRLLITAENVVLPNTKKVQVSIEGDKMQKNGADILGVTLSHNASNFTTSLSIHSGSNRYDPINWVNNGIYAVTTFDNEVTPVNHKDYTHLYVDGINPAVPPGNYEGKLTFTANIIDG